MTLGELGGVENSVLGLSRVDMLFGGELDKDGELTIILLVSSKSTGKKRQTMELHTKKIS